MNVCVFDCICMFLLFLYVFKSLTGWGECWDRPTCRGPAPSPFIQPQLVDPPKCRCVWTWPRQNDSFPKRGSCFLLRETSWRTIENHHLTTINIIAYERETRKVCRSCNDSLPVRLIRRCRNGMISESRLKSPSRQLNSVVITWNHPGSIKGESMWNHGTPDFVCFCFVWQCSTMHILSWWHRQHPRQAVILIRLTANIGSADFIRTWNTK